MLGWDDLLPRDREAGVFYSAAWARVLSESYGFHPYYLGQISGRMLVNLVPIMEVGGKWAPKRAVSLPFSDYCPPILPDGCGWNELLGEMSKYAEARGWRTVQFRDWTTNSDASFSPSCIYYGHRLDLTQSEADLWSSLNGPVRTAIRKAQRSGIGIVLSTTQSAMDEFCRLNAITRKHHGLPPQPRRFFEKVHEYLLRTGLGTIVLGKREGRTIAASVFLRFGENGLYKYGAWDRRWQQLRPNDLVMWEGIRWCRQQGCKKITFGRTSPANNGLRRFKKGWGTSEYVIPYIKYDLRRRTFVTERDHAETGWHRRVFQVLPIFISRIIGELFYWYAA